MAAGSRLQLLLAATAALLYFLAWSEAPYAGEDSSSYLQVAREVIGGSAEIPLRTPGYPLFLLLTGNAETPGRSLVAIQILLFFSAVFAVTRLLRELGVRNSLVTGFVAVSALPHVVQPAAHILTESLAQSLLTLAFVCFGYGILRRRTQFFLLSGLLLGYCSLVRPEYQLVPFLLAVIYLGSRRLRGLRLSALRGKTAGAFALVVPTLVLTLSLAGYYEARYGIRSSRLLTLSLALRAGNYIEHLPDESAELREILVRHRNAELIDNRHHWVRGYVHRAWPELVDHFGGDQLAARRALMAAVIEVVKREPRAMLLEVGRSFPHFWEWTTYDPPGIRGPVLASALLLLHYATVLLFFLAAAMMTVSLVVSAGLRRNSSLEGALALTRGFDRLILASVGIVLLAMLVCSALGVVVPRYRLPTDLLIIFTAILFLEGALRARARLAEEPDRA